MDLPSDDWQNVFLIVKAFSDSTMTGMKIITSEKMISFDYIFTIKIHQIQNIFPDHQTFVKELKKEYCKIIKELKTEIAELNKKG